MKSLRQIREAYVSPAIDATSHSYHMLKRHIKRDSISDTRSISPQSGPTRHKPSRFQKISSIRHKGVKFDVLTAKSGPTRVYRVIDARKKLIHIQSHGEENKAGNYSVDETSSTGMGPKVHKLYAHLLKKGHQKSITSTSHSIGGMKVWNRLGAERGVAMHGWDFVKSKPVNIDPTNPHETHNIDAVDNLEVEKQTKGELPTVKRKANYFSKKKEMDQRQSSSIGSMQLVAFRKPRKWKK